MKNILHILKALGVITGAVGAVWAAFEVFDRIEDGQTEQQQNHEEILEAVCSVKKEVDSLTVITKQVIIQQDNLEKSFHFYRHNVNEMTEDQMEEVIINAYGMGYETAKKKELTSLLIEEGYTQ